MSKGTYRERALQEVGSRLDTTRVHFLGKIPYSDYLRVLQISTAPMYLTYPFVLSWSMLEAMAAGCLIIGSKTPPVEEVIQHERNGLLVNFFSPDQIVEAVNRVCDSKDRLRDLRMQARQTVLERYDFNKICLPQHIRLIEGNAPNIKKTTAQENTVVLVPVLPTTLRPPKKREMAPPTKKDGKDKTKKR